MPKKKEGGNKTYVDLHLVVESIVHDQTMTHADTMRLHGVSRSIVIISNVLVVKVSHALLGLGGLLSWDLKCLCARSCRGLVWLFFFRINCDMAKGLQEGRELGESLCDRFNALSVRQKGRIFLKQEIGYKSVAVSTPYL